MSCSTTAVHHPHGVLELHGSETATLCFTASDTSQAAPVAQSPGNYAVIEQSTCQVANRSHDSVSDNTIPNLHVEADFVHLWIV
jgi:hypothetical protein